ncbi:MAG: 3'-5' exonuclease domain-containing protein 2 [Prevotella sp.]|nr:3'-5' exonuclease domain-containing protein 2 [Prevotella sp.]
MKKTIYNKFDKEEISKLPSVNFTGRIIVVMTANEAEKAVNYLLSQDILGVDTETRPSFRKGENYQVSLLQVSSRDICFLFRLNLMGMPPAVIRLLENKEVPMIGLSWHDDLTMLRRRTNFEPGRFIDIQDMVGDLGIADLSLQKLYANIFHQHISKRQRLSNWNADVLNDKQKIYAATDAWACINLYDEIKRLRESGDYELIVVEEKDETETKEQQS